jgi:hypothetical protein
LLYSSGDLLPGGKPLEGYLASGGCPGRDFSLFGLSFEGSPDGGGDGLSLLHRAVYLLDGPADNDIAGDSGVGELNSVEVPGDRLRVSFLDLGELGGRGFESLLRFAELGLESGDKGVLLSEGCLGGGFGLPLSLELGLDDGQVLGCGCTIGVYLAGCSGVPGLVWGPT